MSNYTDVADMAELPQLQPKTWRDYTRDMMWRLRSLAIFVTFVLADIALVKYVSK